MALDDDALWYKDAVIYELHVRAFYDSDGDGIGDFAGLAERLDYLQDLGVTALWLLPFYPSPLRDDGYDIADYRNVHPNYGTLRAFRTFLQEAHRRGLRVITELVLNHTSDQHPWFQAARNAPPGSAARDYYVWSDNPEKYKEARIIFKDFEGSNWSWDPVAKAYFWHRFYSHQPDLNFDNPTVYAELVKVVNFWLRMGVDGLRLDAVPYLHEREGTSCENLPETHAVLKNLRKHVDAKFANRMLLAEANQWPEDAIAYLGDGDECHMAFHFPLMPRMFMALSMEDRFPIIDILKQTPPIPETAQWAMFLRNHDELTLEMVTDEERDYMYRAYGYERQMRINLGIRRRLAPLLGNNRRKIELMNSLLFSLSGTPVVYYGDEIGMGDNAFLGDRNGVRTPLQWSPDRNAGFSRANPHRLYLPVIIDPEYHYEAINIETQRSNPQSLLWWMKRLIAHRKRYAALRRGTLEFLYPENRHVLVYLRRYQDERILIVANLSRFVQCVELNLSEFRGMTPVEVFGHTEFPAIGDLPYFLTLGPHAFYWFSLEPARVGVVTGEPSEQRLPELAVAGNWNEVFRSERVARLEGVLQEFLPRRRWFGSKNRIIAKLSIVELITVPVDSTDAYVAMVKVEYTRGGSELYVLPMMWAGGGDGERIQEWHPNHLIAKLRANPRHEAQDGVLYDATVNPKFCEALLNLIVRNRRARGRNGELTGARGGVLRRFIEDAQSLPGASLLSADQSNSSVLYGEQLILKLFRRIDEGLNPDLELGRFLTDVARFEHAPPVAGALEYVPARGERWTLGILQGFVPNEGNAWKYTLDNLRSYFERVVSGEASHQNLELPAGQPWELLEAEIPPIASELIELYLESATLLGTRTAELHAALSSATSDPQLRPEPFAPLDQRSLYQSMRNLAAQVFEPLSKATRNFEETEQVLAQKVLEREAEVLRRFRAILDHRLTAMRIRCHGDYHLGQVLYTGNDFTIIDFEGEPARSIGERRLKRPALRDVAGMLRSFHYAGETALSEAIHDNTIAASNVEQAERLVRFWYTWVSVAFLKGYVGRGRGSVFLPERHEETAALLDVHLLEKALYEINYEMNNRPQWVRIPLRGIVQLLEPSGAEGPP